MSLNRVRKRKITSKTASLICKDIDRISELSDELLIKILSYLPTKVAVSTSILSKRWEFLWMWLSKLKFSCGSGQMSQAKIFGRFLNRNLPLHRAPVIESFNLNLSSPCLEPEDVKLWIVIALSHYLRELKISYPHYTNPHYSNGPNILPRNLYTCKSLVVLKLRGRILLDVPRMVCLPSLKTLQLHIDKCLDGESLRRLLSICPVLEDLLVYGDRFTGVVGLISVIVPTLQRLSLYIPSEGFLLDGLVIDTPCLKYLKLEDYNEHYNEYHHSYSIENMPQLEEAHVDVRFPVMSKLIGSIISVKRLMLCSEAVYGDGFIFNELEQLKLCVCSENPSNLLIRLLEDSPNLRVLDIVEIDHYDMFKEEEPIFPECVLSSLRTFNWSRYFKRRPQEKDLAVYICGKRWSLKNCKNLV